MPTERHRQVRQQSPFYGWCGVLWLLPNKNAELEAVALALATLPEKADPEEPFQTPHWWVMWSQPARPLQAWDVVWLGRTLAPESFSFVQAAFTESSGLCWRLLQPLPGSSREQPGPTS